MVLGCLAKLEKNLGPLPGRPHEGWPVSARVNSPKNNDAEIIMPVELETVTRPENQPQLL
jgi:hypothetical protein